MRCYLVAEQAADTSTLQEVLRAAGIEVVTPERGYAGFARSGRLPWLPEVDFLCVVFAGRLEAPTPPAIYMDIGVAIGSGLPTLVIVEPPRVADSVLAPLQVVQLPLGSASALSFRLNAFLKSMGQSPIPPIEQPRPDIETLHAFRRELDSLLEPENASISYRYQHFEDIVVRLLEVCGASTEGGPRAGGQGFDIAAWVPGTETVLPGPLLIETKLVSRPTLSRSDFDMLQHTAASRNAAMGLLLYYSLSRQPLRPPSGVWPMVIAFEVGDLLTQLERQSLAQLIVRARNALVHGRPQ
ncbi:MULTISPECIES: hypothetical protein [Streptacidiphilus]|uniref:Restriction endonuclease type IV Mrr domain-containing protein n=1 Tax=Streptacidiphilus cavernicola TaxID=3342716 RepID=A0ABV6ULT1_9ACTN|nr:hypothetical protein [Streptacidiphilus jeojiense]